MPYFPDSSRIFGSSCSCEVNSLALSFVEEVVLLGGGSGSSGGSNLEP